MAQRYDFRLASTGSTIIPIADATHYCIDMSDDYGTGEVYVALYNSSDVQIAGTAGTITFTGSPDGTQYLAATSNGVVTATTLKAAGTDSTYTPSVFDGQVTKLKMVLSSLAGTDASYVRAWTIRR